MNQVTDRVLAACDGACKGNPGPAAWAWVLAEDVDGGPGRWAAGALGVATNNIAELTALEDRIRIGYARWEELEAKRKASEGEA